MSFVKRAYTTDQSEILEGDRKEVELIFNHELVNMVEK